MSKELSLVEQRELALLHASRAAVQACKDTLANHASLMPEPGHLTDLLEDAVSQMLKLKAAIYEEERRLG